ncbi:twin-arginine translocation protein, TatA/E family subunit [Magnetococcus marinus MC-1]|uniref:Sec-independent protein translocase protein TatA n=1 Tax=Magnetococcus marinus (strain ATCC BAA-1437 / JCM 17883 / MC-1) TaxID=156889 RepID=TATA_MAGMM|nr:twin-arginine translocase TatA/TatE family subunit [Magnetococcus marinus]A0L835.1 RecName: Full=Sec-independent protein translocase protein TatA [Magnetococcus marinus MC-1]ABK44128.1 twin-arginine translocation protein, TatA/E family subunit [Magnetococcus marinus MC-1]
MFGLGTMEMVIILVIVLVIFGAGKLPKVMGDMGRGVKSFKKAMNAEDDAPAEPEVSKPAAAESTEKKDA